ncbi:MAG: hypothetical protein JWO63_1419 [Frankiales bacterium]|jgi:uncharacterized membrane protein|nr:hypothetical protein [Frankiales bacterium]
MTTFPRAALLGLATGSRSSLGLTALAVTAAQGSRRRGHSWLRSPWVARAALVATAGELTGDKLPQTPSRLEPAGFVPRLVLGGVAGAILSYREGRSPGHRAASGAIGVLAAAAGAQLGASWRNLAAEQFGSDLPGAFAEDALAIGAAALAVTGR